MQDIIISQILLNLKQKTKNNITCKPSPKDDSEIYK